MTADEARLVRDAVTRFVRAFGLHQPERTPCGQAMSVSEAHALAELHRDGPLRQVELARRLRLEKSTVSRLVGLLADRGWLARAPADEDGRGLRLALTDEGSRAAQRLAEAREARFAALLERIPAGERATVLHAVRRLAEAAEDPT